MVAVSMLNDLLWHRPVVNADWYRCFSRFAAEEADWLSLAESVITEAYVHRVDARDGFSRVGCFLMEQGHLAKALVFFEKDAAHQRASWWQQLRHAECLGAAGHIPEAEAAVERVYAAHPDARNGYAMLGVRLGLADVARRDRDAGRLTPGYALNVAVLLMQSDALTEAADLVEWAYAADRQLQDGFSRLAALLSDRGRAEEAGAFFRRDADAGRLSSKRRIFYAGLLAERGQNAEAHEEVRQAYAEDSGLLNGYAHLGFLDWQKGDYDAALSEYQRDADAGRLTGDTRAVYAELLARADQWEDAEREMVRAVEERPLLQNAFARLGYVCRQEERYAEALAWYRRDADAGRLTPEAWLGYAELLVHDECREEAEAAVSHAYAGCPDLQNGWARLGHIYWKKKDGAAALDLYERDARSGRLTPKARLDYAELLAQAARHDEAECEVERAYEEDSSLMDGYIRLLKYFDMDQQARTLFCGGKDLRRDRASCSGRMRSAVIIRAQSTLAGELAAFADREADGPDVAAQYRTLHQAAMAGECPEDPMPVLNAEIYITHPSDALVQFRELVLEENYYFESATPSPVIIDGGANMGMAMAYFKWLYPESRIAAFEPHPTMLETCRKNIEHNAWSHIALHHCALLDREGEVTLNALDNMPMGSSVTGRLSDQYEPGAVRCLTVPGRRLSPFITGPVDFLKLDIEGAETQVMRELGDRLSLVRRGFIEYHYGTGVKENRLGELLGLLEAYGFSYRLADPPARSTEMPLHGRQVAFHQPWSCSIFFQQAEFDRNGNGR